MKENVKKGIQPSWWMGIVWFVMVILMMFFIATPIQMRFGMVGVAITELILLVMAVVPAFVCKWDFKKVFPFHKPRIAQVFGVFLLWGGSFLIAMVSSLVGAYILPADYQVTTSGMQSLFASVSPLALFFIIAIMPAICEEALHRGLILFTFSNVKRKWLVCLAMGIIFGAFHMDPVRFLQTAVLGLALTYIVLETGNLWLSILFHFINNTVSTLSSLAVQAGAGEQVNEALSSGGNALTASTLPLGIYCILSVAAPFLILFGCLLLHTKKKPDEKAFLNARKLIITTICSVLFLISGIVFTANGMKEFWFTGMNTTFSQFDITDTQHVTCEATNGYTVEPAKAGDFQYSIEVNGGSENVGCSVEIYDSNGECIFNSGTAGAMTMNGNLYLEKAEYNVHFHYVCQPDSVADMKVRIIVK